MARKIVFFVSLIGLVAVGFLFDWLNLLGRQIASETFTMTVPIAMNIGLNILFALLVLACAGQLFRLRLSALQAGVLAVVGILIYALAAAFLWGLIVPGEGLLLFVEQVLVKSYAGIAVACWLASGVVGLILARKNSRVSA